MGNHRADTEKLKLLLQRVLGCFAEADAHPSLRVLGVGGILVKCINFAVKES
jgi:hypothetical protein